jgi:transcriptional regulator with XRE-family HTH domain
MITTVARYPKRHPLGCQEEALTKPKSVKQLFREGLKTARLRLAGVRGHYVTPEELGGEIGKTGQTIRNYESGETEPTLEDIDKLLRATGTEPAWPPFSNVVPIPQALPGEEGGKDGAVKRRRRAR